MAKPKRKTTPRKSRRKPKGERCERIAQRLFKRLRDKCGERLASSAAEALWRECRRADRADQKARR